MIDLIEVSRTGETRPLNGRALSRELAGIDGEMLRRAVLAGAITAVNILGTFATYS
jgi:hypothetical protein